jgi:hypothetical protein
VIGLDQISHAMVQAGVAATTIRNELCELTTLVCSSNGTFQDNPGFACEVVTCESDMTEMANAAIFRFLVAGNEAPDERPTRPSRP